MKADKRPESSDSTQGERELLSVIDAFTILDAAALDAAQRKDGFEFAVPVITAYERYAAQYPDTWQLFLNTGVDALARIELEGPGVVTQELTKFLEQNPAPQASNPA